MSSPSLYQYTPPLQYDDIHMTHSLIPKQRCMTDITCKQKSVQPSSFITRTTRGLTITTERLRIQNLRAEFYDCTWYFLSLVSWYTPEINLTKKTIIYSAQKFANILNLSVSFRLSICFSYCQFTGLSILLSFFIFSFVFHACNFRLFYSFLLFFSSPCFRLLLSIDNCIFACFLFN